MQKLISLLALFKHGSAVADPQLWKQRQINATVVAAFLVAIANTAKAFGYDFEFDLEQANAIAVGIVALTNFVLTCTTSDKIGYKPKLADGEQSSAVPANSTEQVRADPELAEALPAALPTTPVATVESVRNEVQPTSNPNTTAQPTRSFDINQYYDPK